MDVSVVTPSFKMLEFLKRCCASVADQAGATRERLVMDRKSSDGSAEWLANNAAVTSAVEKDNGTSDALNKGFRRARREVISHLDGVEQYLAGARAFVKAYFDRHPSVDAIFGDTLL